MRKLKTTTNFNQILDLKKTNFKEFIDLEIALFLLLEHKETGILFYLEFDQNKKGIYLLPLKEKKTEKELTKYFEKRDNIIMEVYEDYLKFYNHFF